MSREESFLTEIAGNPADHSTRMAYADWLSDQGRGDEAALLFKLLAFPTISVMERLKLGREISTDAAKLLGFGELSYDFHIKQPEWKLTLDQFLKPANRKKLFLYAALTTVRITGIGNRMHQLAASPHLRALTKLDLYTNLMTAETVQALVRSPHLCNLAELSLENNHSIGDAGIRILAAWPVLSQLHKLKLHGTGIGPTGVEALAASPHLRPITGLDLSNNTIGPEGARALAGSRQLGNLTRLHLNKACIGDAGLRALADSGHLPKLTHLNLYRNDITTAGLRALAASGHRRNLTQLDLSGNLIDPDGAQTLADSELMQNLTYLDMSHNPIGANGAEALEHMRAAAGRGRALELHYKHTPQHRPHAPKGKWSRHVVQDTDRFLHPFIA